MVGDGLPGSGDLQARLEPFREPQRDAGAEVVTGGRWLLGSAGLVHEDELRVATRHPHLDMAGVELRVEREGRLGEEVDQPETERRLDRVGEAAPAFGDVLVGEGGGNTPSDPA